MNTPLYDELAAELEDLRGRDHVIRLRHTPIPQFPVPEWTQAVVSNA